MSKTSLLAGCVLAAALHGLLLVPLLPSGADEAGGPEAPPKTKLAVAPPTEPKPTEPPPTEPKPRAIEKPKAGKADPKPKPPMQQVARAPVQPEPERPDEADASPGRDDKALPPMRIAWSSPQQVRTVARALGLRIVAVNAAGRAVGEIDPYDGRLRDFTGRLDQYSNRVRTLGRSFFAAFSPGDDVRDVAGFWILVPAAVDRQWMALQSSAIARHGMTAAQVRQVEARFTVSGGQPRLSITRVHARKTPKRETGTRRTEKET